MITQRHDVIIRLGDDYLVLLPTLRAIAALERYFDCALGTVIQNLCTRGLSNAACSYIIWIAAERTPRKNYSEILACVEKESAESLAALLHDFFFAALNIEPEARLDTTQEAILPWNEMQQLAYTALDMLPDEFWNLTLKEFQLLAFGFENETSAPTQNEVAALLHQHPDTTSNPL